MGISCIDESWMREAIAQAKLAAELDEVPVGAIIIDADDQLIAAAHNQPIATHDPTAHAEINALRIAANKLKNYRLSNTTLYVTLEPCTMCIGAIVQARVARVVYAATEPKTGAVESAHQLFETGEYNHKPEIQGGVLADESTALLREFFEAKRLAKKAAKLK